MTSAVVKRVARCGPAATRLVATDGAARHVTAVLDAIAARPSRAVRWIARLAHVASEPGGSGGRRPDRADRYLRSFLRRHPAGTVAAPVRELDGEDLIALRPAGHPFHPRVGHQD